MKKKRSYTGMLLHNNKPEPEKQRGTEKKIVFTEMLSPLFIKTCTIMFSYSIVWFNNNSIE